MLPRRWPEADWVGLPVIWGNTAFSIFGKDFDSGMLLTAIITIAPISLATVVEHIGDICAISSTVTSISARRLLMLTWDLPSLRGISAQSFSKCAFTADLQRFFLFSMRRNQENVVQRQLNRKRSAPSAISAQLETAQYYY